MFSLAWLNSLLFTSGVQMLVGLHYTRIRLGPLFVSSNSCEYIKPHNQLEEEIVSAATPLQVTTRNHGLRDRVGNQIWLG